MNSWIVAARPKTLLATVAPVMLGSAIAAHDGAFDAVRALVALVGGLCIQVGTNYFNDYADFRLGADTEQRVGPTRAVAAGLLSQRAMLTGTAVAFGLALFCALLLVRWAGWPMLAIGGVSVACGVWYTAGRYSLAYLGLGELFVVLFFGLVATGGTYYVQAMQLPWYAWVSGLVPGLLATALIGVNNWRDIAEDRAAEKRTLAVRFGSGFAFWEYALCLGFACGLPAFIFSRLPDPSQAWLLLLFPVPFLFLVGQQVDPAQKGVEVVPLLARTALLLLGITALFSLAWVLA